jgi:hypothetical protein
MIDCRIDLTTFDGTFYFSSPDFDVNPYASYGNEIKIPVSVNFLNTGFESGGRPLNGQCFLPAGVHAIRRVTPFEEVEQWSTIRGGSQDTDKWNVGTASVTNGSRRVDLSGLTGVTATSFGISSVTAYGLGTVSANNGSPIITGVTTNWLAQNFTPTDTISINGGPLYRILSVDSATQITLETNYGESNVTGQSYVITKRAPNRDYIRIQGQDTPILITTAEFNTGTQTGFIILDTPWTGANGSSLLFHVNPAWQWRATKINGTIWRQIKAGSPHTLSNWDSGSVLEFTSNSPIVLNLPATIAAGTEFRWIQKGTGLVTFTVGAGATLTNINSHIRSGGQNTEGRLTVSNNFNNTAAAYRLSGETS